MNETKAPTFYAAIHMAGDITQARQVCRQYCFEVGLCVTVTPTTYIYTGGEESGFTIRLINYPRFPAAPDEIFSKAKSLTELLITQLHQHSASIETPVETTWLSRRDYSSK